MTVSELIEALKPLVQSDIIRLERSWGYESIVRVGRPSSPDRCGIVIECDMTEDKMRDTVWLLEEEVKRQREEIARLKKDLRVRQMPGDTGEEQDDSQ